MKSFARMLISTGAAALLCAPVPGLSLAAGQTGAKPAEGTADAKRSEEVVCKRIAPTGSKVKRLRACLTRAEWAEQSERGRQQVRDLVDQGTIDPAGDDDYTKQSCQPVC